eukprot:TRINITY_DN1281_c0_g1_i1.p1 TRINITY_DN1281_c0_g1~~TRINITY_DN1281_c0_g1_i1.p1  ORF type:complete len:221 (+),score=73.98 TRINITY_DN1281_c0_g1_i1:28-690(+)
MAERKGVQRYIRPENDFGIQNNKGKRKKRDYVESRIECPFTIQCDECNDYLYRGTKFHTHKYVVKDEDYLGFKLFEFHLHCKTCGNVVILRTDPQNATFIVKEGGKMLAKHIREKEEEEKEKDNLQITDTMTQMEKLAERKRREIEVSKQLAEIQSFSLKSINNDAILDFILDKQRKSTEFIQNENLENEPSLKYSNELTSYFVDIQPRGDIDTSENDNI